MGISQQRECLTGDGRVVKRKTLLPDDLVGLVPLSGYEYDVTGARLCDRTLDRQPAIELDDVPARLGCREHVVDDGAWFSLRGLSLVR